MEFGEKIYSSLSKIMDPSRFVMYLVCLFILYWAYSEISNEAPSPTSSPGGSPQSSPERTPPQSPRTVLVDSGVKAMSDNFLKQQAVLSSLADGQAKLAAAVSDLADDRRAARFFQEAQGGGRFGTIAKELSEKLEHFEEILRKDKDSAPVDITPEIAGSTRRAYVIPT